MEIYQNPSGIMLKEYGRNLQGIVSYIITVEDRATRTKLAHTCVELMRQLNPTMKDAQDQYNKLWDHLYIMSDFKLDVDSPYPLPERSVLEKKPMKVDYNQHNLRFRHYGRNVELMIQRAIDMTDKEEQLQAIVFVGKLMKRFYGQWNKEGVDDEVIVQHLDLMSRGKLPLPPLSEIKASNLFDIREDYGHSNNNRREHHRGGHSNGGGQHHRRNHNQKFKRKK